MKKKIILFSVFTAVILTAALGIRAAVSQAASKPSPLRVKGTRIVNASGKTMLHQNHTRLKHPWHRLVSPVCEQILLSEF